MGWEIRLIPYWDPSYCNTISQSKQSYCKQRTIVQSTIVQSNPSDCKRIQYLKLIFPRYIIYKAFLMTFYLFFLPCSLFRHQCRERSRNPPPRPSLGTPCTQEPLLPFLMGGGGGGVLRNRSTHVNEQWHLCVLYVLRMSIGRGRQVRTEGKWWCFCWVE